MKKLMIYVPVILLLMCGCANAPTDEAPDGIVEVAPTVEAIAVETAEPTAAPTAEPTVEPEATNNPESHAVEYFSDDYECDTWFSAPSLTEFEKRFVARKDLRDKYGYGLTYYLPQNIPDGYVEKRFTCGSERLSAAYTGRDTQITYSLFAIPATEERLKVWSADLESSYRDGTYGKVSLDGVTYYHSMPVVVSPNDGDDTPGPKAKQFEIFWYDKERGLYFTVRTPFKYTEWDDSLLKYCEFVAVDLSDRA